MGARRSPTTMRGEGGLQSLCCIGVAVLFLVPLVWMVSGSLRDPGLPPLRTVEWVPAAPAWSNYRRLFDVVPFGRYLLNSLTVAGLAVPVTLLTASWAGFAMAGLDARRRATIVLLSAALLMVPVTAVWLTRYAVLGWLGLLDTHAALLAPAVGGSSPLFVLLFYWTFRRIPEELFAAAATDGADLWTQWHALAMPLARPASITVGVLTFITYWGDFISPLMYLKSEALYTAPVGLQQLQQLDRSHWPLLMAACVVFTAPTLLFFLVVQRYLLEQSPITEVNG
jgi:multiple sugar transport system permease protein